ncbi:MAG: phage/plasmid primase, P4 family [Patescibacteria group bacterium]
MTGGLVSMWKTAKAWTNTLVTIDTILEDIRAPKWKASVEEVRAILASKGKDAADERKVDLLPAVTFTGTFDRRHKIELFKEHSGFGVLDFDDLNDLNKDKARLASDPFVYAVFISPGGKGLKVIVKIQPDASKHKLFFAAATAYFKREHNLDTCPTGSDISRLCFVSYDPELAHNPDAVVFATPPAEEPAPAPASKPRPAPRPAATLARYIQAAVQAEVQAVSTTQNGQRNARLNQAAYALGQFVGAGLLPKSDAETALMAAARGCGLPDQEAAQTIRSGLTAGEKSPRQIPERPSAKKPRNDRTTQTANVSRLDVTRDPLDAAKEGQPLARTDTGLAERFAFYHGAEVAYQTESGAWFVWDGKRWARDPGLVEIRRRLAETARKIKDECSALPESMGAQARMDYFRFALSCEQISRMDAAARLAPSLGLARSLTMFDADPMRFCVKNGTIDLRTGTLHPHKREEFITRFSPVAFIPDATDPIFRQFIDHATTGDAELELYLQRAAGYTLSGHIHEKCLFIVYCTATDTGKTCFVTGLLTVLGEYGMTIGFDSLLEPDHGGQPNYDLAKLCGARLAVASETKPGRRFAAELIKQLTGGDTLRAREIRQSSVEFRPTHKLWLSTNHAPMLSDGGDAATWNRLRRVPFNNQIPRVDRDPRILAALSDPNSPAARAFLAWAVAGAVLWSEQGLGTCSAVEQSTAEYQSETDPLLDFIEDCCELHRDFCTISADLRRVYEDWSSKNGQRYPLSRQRFAAVLLKHGCKEHRGHGGVRSWLGIGIKTTG